MPPGPRASVNLQTIAARKSFGSPNRTRIKLLQGATQGSAHPGPRPQETCILLSCSHLQIGIPAGTRWSPGSCHFPAVQIRVNGTAKRSSPNGTVSSPSYSTTPVVNRSPAASRSFFKPRKSFATTVPESLTSTPAIRRPARSRTASTSAPSLSRKWWNWIRS